MGRTTSGSSGSMSFSKSRTYHTAGIAVRASTSQGQKRNRLARGGRSSWLGVLSDSTMVCPALSWPGSVAKYPNPSRGGRGDHQAGWFLFRLGSRRACSAKSSVSTRPLPERTPSFTSNRRRSSRNGRATSRWARIGQGIRCRSATSSNPHCSGRDRDQCFIRWYSSPRRMRAKSGPGGSQRGQATLIWKSIRQGSPSLIHEDVFAFVQIDVNDFPIMHRPEKGAKLWIK